jgi:hypothetical protein
MTRAEAGFTQLHYRCHSLFRIVREIRERQNDDRQTGRKGRQFGAVNRRLGEQQGRPGRRMHEVRQPCAVDQVQLAQENEFRVALKRTLDPSLRLTRADT